MADLTKFSIEADPVGVRSLVVDGREVSGAVSGLDIQSRPGQPTVVTLHHIAAAGRIEGEGIVRVVEREAAGPEALVEWLNSIDPTALEDEVLKRSGFGDSTFDVALSILREWATRGRP